MEVPWRVCVCVCVCVARVASAVAQAGVYLGRGAWGGPPEEEFAKFGVYPRNCSFPTSLARAVYMGRSHVTKQ